MGQKCIRAAACDSMTSCCDTTTCVCTTDTVSVPWVSPQVNAPLDDGDFSPLPMPAVLVLTPRPSSLRPPDRSPCQPPLEERSIRSMILDRSFTDDLRRQQHEASVRKKFDKIRAGARRHASVDLSVVNGLTPGIEGLGDWNRTSGSFDLLPTTTEGAITNVSGNTFLCLSKRNSESARGAGSSNPLIGPRTPLPRSNSIGF